MNKHKINLTIRQHNKLFKYRQVKLLTYYEIIDDPQNRDIEMRQYIRMPVRIIYILLSPLAIFVGGVPCMIALIKECLSNKDLGADTINREWFYKQFRGGDQNTKNGIQAIESNGDMGGDQKERGGHETG